MKKAGIFVLALICLLMFSACGVQKEDGKKIRDVEFTVTDSIDIPEELQTQIEELKKEPFEITYGDQGYLYIAKGYGARETTGYSVRVLKCYETKNNVHLETQLYGPPKEEEIIEEETCPYIVIKTEYTDKNVMFD